MRSPRFALGRSRDYSPPSAGGANGLCTYTAGQASDPPCVLNGDAFLLKNTYPTTPAVLHAFCEIRKSYRFVESDAGTDYNIRAGLSTSGETLPSSIGAGCKIQTLRVCIGKKSSIASRRVVYEPWPGEVGDQSVITAESLAV